MNQNTHNIYFKTKHYLACCITTLAFASNCYAGPKKQEAVNFLGTWSAESEAIYTGTGNFDLPEATWTKPKYLNTQSTITIVGQNGHKFWGNRVTGKEPPKPFIAIIDPSENTIVAADANGVIRGQILNKNRFTYCYTQLPKTTNQSAYVECTIANRTY